MVKSMQSGDVPAPMKDTDEVGEIAQLVSTLRSRASGLADAINAMENTLTPILTSDDPSDPVKTERASTNTPLGHELDGIAGYLEDLRYAIIRLTERVAL